MLSNEGIHVAELHTQGLDEHWDGPCAGIAGLRASRSLGSWWRYCQGERGWSTHLSWTLTGQCLRILSLPMTGLT